MKVFHCQVQDFSRIENPLQLHTGGLTTVEELHQAIVTGAETHHQPQIRIGIEIEISLSGFETATELVSQKGGHFHFRCQGIRSGQRRPEECEHESSMNHQLTISALLR